PLRRSARGPGVGGRPSRRWRELPRLPAELARARTRVDAVAQHRRRLAFLAEKDASQEILARQQVAAAARELHAALLHEQNAFDDLHRERGILLDDQDRQ